MTLSETVLAFAQLTYALLDHQLELDWSWGEYDEGVRFAFFRAYEELRQLAAQLEILRSASSHPLTTAQRILAQYHAAYRDLSAIVLGVDDSLARQTPSEGEWSLVEVLHHIVGVERNFYAANLYGLERQRQQDERPLEMTEEAWDAFWASDSFVAIKEDGAWVELMSYYDGLHQRVIASFQNILDQELEIPIAYWEKENMQLRFRLHRFDSHLRQHTIQVEKTLTAITRPPGEAKRLLRQVFGALAQAEGVLIGEPLLAAGLQDEVCTRISGYTAEIAQVLA